MSFSIEQFKTLKPISGYVCTICIPDSTNYKYKSTASGAKNWTSVYFPRFRNLNFEGSIISDYGEFDDYNDYYNYNEYDDYDDFETNDIIFRYNVSRYDFYAPYFNIM